MGEENASGISVIGATFILGAIGAIACFFLYVIRMGSSNECEDPADPQSSEKENEANLPDVKKKNGGAGDGKSRSSWKAQKKVTKHTFSHAWLANSLKGHGGTILGMDFSPNGKYLVTCSEDRSVMLWGIKDFATGSQKSIRGNVEYDHATKIKFSPDNRALVVSLGIENTIRILRIAKKEDSSSICITGALDFPDKYNHEILNIGIASTGHYLMTCYSDNKIKIWTIKGELLHTIDTKQMKTSHAAVSPCGRFVASCGFTPDVKAWQIKFDRGGNFQEVKRAWELKGHSAGIHHFAFSNDSTRVATVSKDGTWRVWDTDVDFERGGDPRLLNTGSHVFKAPCLISLSHDIRSVTIACGTSLAMYDVVSGEAEHMTNVHGDNIQAIGYDNGSRMIVSVGDKQIQVFHNVLSFRSLVKELEEKLLRENKGSNKNAKERLAKELEAARKQLESTKTQ